MTPRSRHLRGCFEDATPGAGVSFRLRLQARYAQDWSVSHDRPKPDEWERDLMNAQESDGFRMDRAFLRAIARPRKWIQGRLLFDLAELRWAPGTPSSWPTST